jgi:hypothetical protein
MLYKSDPTGFIFTEKLMHHQVADVLGVRMAGPHCDLMYINKEAGMF